MEKQYIVSIDFASKLGYAVWQKNSANYQLIKANAFVFHNNDYQKQFKKTSFQEKLYEKILFENKQAKQLAEEIFQAIDKNSQVHFVIEESDFSQSYAIEVIAKLYAMFLLQIEANKKDCKISVQKMFASHWRKAFKDNNTNIDWNKYLVQKAKRKVLNWKQYALDFLPTVLHQHKITLSDKLLKNNDLAEAVLIGYTFINYLQKESKEQSTTTQKDIIKNR